ncbi:MAG TPA: universal stress protein [Jiangellaceae bacterium]
MDASRPGRVIVGIDPSPSGMRALRRAVDEARDRDAVLVAVRSWLTQPRMYAVAPDLRDVDEADTRELVMRTFAETFGGFPDDVKVEVEVLPDYPGPALVRLADRDDDLLVLGSGHRNWRGSASRTVRYCVAWAACPVLVIPPPQLVRAVPQRVLLRQLRREIEDLTR